MVKNNEYPDAERLADAIKNIADSIRPLVYIAGEDACGGTITSLTGAVMGITAGLCKIAESLDGVAASLGSIAKSNRSSRGSKHCAVVKRAKLASCKESLIAIFQNAGERWLDINEIINAVADMRGGQPASRSKLVLDKISLLTAGVIESRGKGVKGDPYYYRLRK